MSDTREQVKAFLEKCDEISNCKFIMATGKIKDLLKSIANSRELYKLFDAVTENFDYPAMKASCLVTVSDTYYERSYLALPQNSAQTLAFIFCLLIDFDSDVINFNDFLRKYYPEDGSYYASYRAFCGVVIRSLRDIVETAFSDILISEPAPIDDVKPNAELARSLSAIEILLSYETESINTAVSNATDRESGQKILSALLKAVRAGNVEAIEALICGYNYFVLYNNCVTESAPQLMEAIGEYVNLL